MQNNTNSPQLCDYEDIEFDPNKFNQNLNTANLGTNVSTPNYNNKLGVGASKTGQQLQFTGIMSTGFKDFLFKPELLRAITECGFEHPSEV